MIVFKTQEAREYYKAVEQFAERSGQLAQFRSQIWYLHTYGETSDPRFAGFTSDDPLAHPGTEYSRAWLSKESAPFSFNVALERRVQAPDTQDGFEPWMAMGLLYHGSHDGFGSGSAPTFAVTLTPTRGWSIHS